MGFADAFEDRRATGSLDGYPDTGATVRTPVVYDRGLLGSPGTLKGE
jgi:hypothetical protein